MTIAEAIKYMTFALASFPEGTDPLYVESYKLGIEALKLIVQEPPEGYTCIPRPLPGETEE